MKLFFKDRKAILCLLLFLFAFGDGTNSARAQVDLTTNQALNFGTIAITNLVPVARVTILTGGGFTSSANVVFLSNPTRGEYTLTGGPPNSFFTITTPASISLVGPGGNFTLDNITVRPNNPRTDGAGEEDIFITGRLQSQGAGTPYGDGVYNSTLLLTISF